MEKIKGITIKQMDSEYPIRYDMLFNKHLFDHFVVKRGKLICDMNPVSKIMLFQKLDTTLDDYQELIELYVEQPKYYWHLKGFSKVTGYFGIDVDSEQIWRLCGNNKNKFTEKEFKAICDEKGIVFEAFEKEEIL